MMTHYCSNQTEQSLVDSLSSLQMWFHQLKEDSQLKAALLSPAMICPGDDERWCFHRWETLAHLHSPDQSQSWEKYFPVKYFLSLVNCFCPVVETMMMSWHVCDVSCLKQWSCDITVTDTETMVTRISHEKSRNNHCLRSFYFANQWLIIESSCIIICVAFFSQSLYCWFDLNPIKMLESFCHWHFLAKINCWKILQVMITNEATNETLSLLWTTRTGHHCIVPSSQLLSDLARTLTSWYSGAGITMKSWKRENSSHQWTGQTQPSWARVIPVAAVS